MLASIFIDDKTSTTDIIVCTNDNSQNLAQNTQGAFLNKSYGACRIKCTLRYRTFHDLYIIFNLRCREIAWKGNLSQIQIKNHFPWKKNLYQIFYLKRSAIILKLCIKKFHIINGNDTHKNILNIIYIIYSKSQETWELSDDI